MRWVSLVWPKAPACHAGDHGFKSRTHRQLKRLNMRRLIKFLKSLKDPCKLCLVKAICYKGTECLPYNNHIRAKNTIRYMIENVISVLLVFGMIEFIFICVLIILGLFQLYNLIF